MEETRRRFKRFTIDFMQVKGRMAFSSTVDIIDISLGGISLKIDRRLNIGSNYILKLAGRDRPITVRGAVAWASLHESRSSSDGGIIPIYAVGMKFNDVSNENIAELVNFIESQADDKPDVTKIHSLSALRLHMRFCVSESGKAVLTCSENYTIKKISSGGMLIETSNPLTVTDKLPMEISLPEERKINFLGRIASCTLIEDKEPKVFAIGIEFLNMPKDSSSQMNEFIRMLDH